MKKISFHAKRKTKEHDINCNAKCEPVVCSECLTLVNSCCAFNDEDDDSIIVCVDCELRIFFYAR
jgi:hypothetical protein